MAPNDALSKNQKVRMSQNVVSGTPHLAGVLTTYRQACRASGKSINISFDTHVLMLPDQAQVHDNANARARNSYRRTANAHDIEGDEGHIFDANVHDHIEEECEQTLEEFLDLEANVTAQRDRRTGKFVPKKPSGTRNAQRQANQMEQPRQRRAYVDQETWNSISEDDRRIWDTLSNSSRTKITSYHFNKGKEYALRGAEANKMEAKEHDMIFDDDLEEENSSDIEARVHETGQFTPSYSDATRQICEDEGVDFDQILQAQQANTRLHAGMYRVGFNDTESDSEDEEDSGIEVYMHSQDYNPRVGVVDFSDTDDKNSNSESKGEEAKEPNEMELLVEEQEP